MFDINGFCSEVRELSGMGIYCIPYCTRGAKGAEPERTSLLYQFTPRPGHAKDHQINQVYSASCLIIVL